MAAGHAHEAIWDEYTTEEIQQYYEAILRYRAAREIDLSRVIRVSNNAKDSKYRKYIRQLRRTGKDIEKAMGRTVSVEKFFGALEAKIGGVRKITRGNNN